MIGIIPISVCFLILMAFYGFYFSKYLRSYTITEPIGMKSYSYAILIPTRNPTHNLKILVNDLESQIIDKKKSRIIVINDNSDSFLYTFDNSIEVLHLEKELPALTKSTNNKKAAIEYVVSKYDADYFICLDSDVIIPNTYVESMVQFIENKSPIFVAGVHRFISDGTLFKKLLRLDQDLLSTISIASLSMGFPTMCNGANMAFSKTGFIAVKGYSGLHDVVGGDDMLLYHRLFTRDPSQVYYILDPNTIVSSDSPRNMIQLFKQRIRWMQKTMDYEVWWILPQLAIVYIFQMSLIVLLIFGMMKSYLLFVYILSSYGIFAVSTKLFKENNPLTSLFYIIIFPVFSLLMTILIFSHRFLRCIK